MIYIFQGVARSVLTQQMKWLYVLLRRLYASHASSAQLVSLQEKQIFLCIELASYGMHNRKWRHTPSVCVVLNFLLSWLGQLHCPVHACKCPLPLCH